MEIDGISIEKKDYPGGIKHFKITTFWLFVFLFFNVTLVLICTTFLFFGDRLMWKNQLINSRSWYVVYLNNDQVYFGHIKTLSNARLKLSQVYGLRPTEMPVGESATSSDFSVVAQKKWYTLVPIQGGEIEISSSEVVFLAKTNEQIGVLPFISQTDKNK